MAVRLYTKINPRDPRFSTGGVIVIQWTGLTFATTDYGEAIQMPSLADRNVQLLGTLGVGGSVRLEGSNKESPDETTATDWATLNDPQGNPLDLSALKAENIMENLLWIRPRVTAGDATTSLTVLLLLRK